MTDLHDGIADLEAEIADLAASAEQCRKTMAVAKFGIAAGGMLLPLILLGFLRFGPVGLLASITAVVGGIVLCGSTKSTRDGLLTEVRSLEARRAEMIDGLGLHTVGSREGA